MTFFNTTKLVNQELREAQRKATTQNQRVLFIFKISPLRKLTKVQMQKQYLWTFEKEILGNSAGRSLTNLTKLGKLEKSEKTVKGPHGAKVHSWRLKPQLSLF